MGHRGQGRIFKRPNSPFWYIGYRVQGREKKESTRSTLKRDAVELLNRRLQETQHFRLGSGPPPTVNTLINHYLLDCERRGVKSVKRMQNQAKVIAGYIGKKRAIDIDALVIRELQEALLASGRAQPTVNHYVEIVRRSFVVAAENGVIHRMPKFPRRLKSSMPRRGFLTQAAFHAIRSELPDWAADVFEFAFYTGWRRSEIFRLTWWNVDLEHLMIRLEGDQTKNKRARQRPIGDDIRPVLQRRLAARIAECALVFHKKGRPIESRKWYLAWNPATKRAGYPGQLLHDCRRTAYRSMVRAGIPPRVAAEMVGWTSMTMPNRYDIVSETDQAEAVIRYAEYIGRQRLEEEANILPFKRI